MENIFVSSGVFSSGTLLLQPRFCDVHTQRHFSKYLVNWDVEKKSANISEFSADRLFRPCYLPESGTQTQTQTQTQMVTSKWSIEG